MKEQELLNYQRVKQALEYIHTHFKQQPRLDEIAEKIHLSPFHFQRVFTEWAGVSPKKFLQYTTIQYAKSLIDQQESTLFDVAYETGLSGSGRLHDLFITIEGMTPGEYKNGGEKLSIHYSFINSPFGELLVASTPKGICHVAFTDSDNQSVTNLRERFPNAKYAEASEPIHNQFNSVFQKELSGNIPLQLHLKGTPFQLKIWETLLKIPQGQLSTYGKIAHAIGSPNSSRAVGTAIGNNPVAVLIPCHRVIQSTGIFGQYHWGSTRKTAMIGWEAAQIDK